MPWRYMLLRNKRVLARCDETGAPLVERGRVEVRYKPDDGRSYRAARGNLQSIENTEIFPDEHCALAEAPPDRERTSTVKLSVGERDFYPEVPAADEILVYADGACSGNPGPAGIGVVMIWEDQRRELSEYLGDATNNIAELTAIQRVVDAVNDHNRPVRIFTDSSYSIGVLTKGWKVKANQELVASVKLGLARLRDVELLHVRGHAGVVLNERADELARQAVETRETAGWMIA